MTIEPVSFLLLGRPPSPNASRREHWGTRSREAATWRHAAYVSARDALLRSGRADDFPLRLAALELVFTLPTASGDLDNLLAGSKPIIDGISRGLGRPGERGPLLYDDGVGTLQSISVRWRRGRTATVEVFVREVT